MHKVKFLHAIQIIVFRLAASLSATTSGARLALGQVSSEYFGFPYQSSFHHLLHNHTHLSSGAGTTGQKWPQYKGLSPTPLAIKKWTLLMKISTVYSTRHQSQLLKRLWNMNLWTSYTNRSICCDVRLFMEHFSNSFKFSKIPQSWR
jgi:hypothetical protein